MKKEYRNAKRSKEMIREATISILDKKKDFNLITITDIVKEANINRGTFYNHYNNVSDVLTEMEDELTIEMTDVLNISMKENDSVANFVYTMTNYIKENEHLYRSIIPYVPKYVLDNLKSKILNEIEKIYFKGDNVSVNKKIPLNIVANGLSGAYLDYFQGRLNVKLDELALYSIKVIDKIVDR